MTNRSGSTPLPPGWYAEASNNPRLRWWDGSEWTDQYRLGPPAETVAEQASRRARRRTAPPPATRAAARAGYAGSVRSTPAETNLVIQSAPEPVAAAEMLGDTGAALHAAYTDATSTAPGIELSPQLSSVAQPVVVPEVHQEAPTSSAKREKTLSLDVQRSGSSGAASAPPFGSSNASTERIPDQIAPSVPRRDADWMPEPIVYRPRSSDYADGPSNGVAEPAPKNAWAQASLFFVALGVIGRGAVVWWIEDADPGLGGVVTTITAAASAAALILGIASLAVAIQRPTRKLQPVIAVVLSTLLMAWVIGTFSLHILQNATL